MRERSGFRSYRSGRTFSHTEGVLERKSWNQKEKNKAWKKRLGGKKNFEKEKSEPHPAS